jgi:hypothetical protein
MRTSCDTDPTTQDVTFAVACEASHSLWWFTAEVSTRQVCYGADADGRRGIVERRIEVEAFHVHDPACPVGIVEAAYLRVCQGEVQP